MNKALSNNVVWFLVAGYFLWVLADSFFQPASTGVSATVNVFFVIAIATFHGLQRYSLKQFLIFFRDCLHCEQFLRESEHPNGLPIWTLPLHGGPLPRHRKSNLIRRIEGTGIKLRPHTRLRVLPGRYLR